MKQKSKAERGLELHARSKEFHIVFGAGGSKAILASTGAIAAFEVIGWNGWRTIGGVSGGSISAALYADGVRAKEIVYLAVHKDFTEFLAPNVGPLGRLWGLFRKYRTEVTMPAKGIYSPEPLQHWLDLTVADWPNNFWTLCTDRGLRHVVITRNGAFRYDPESGSSQPLTSESITIGAAIAGSCAIPGIIDALDLGGEVLFDGAMGVEGNCPVTPPQKHFSASPDKTIAIDVGEEDIKNSWLMRLFWRLGCGFGSCAPFDGRHASEEEDKVLLIEPKIKGFHGLKFLLDKLDKWSAIVAGFRATVETFERHGLISRLHDERVFELYDRLGEIPLDRASRDHCVECIEKLFTEFGVY